MAIQRSKLLTGERYYRLMVGLAVLVFLYFDMSEAMLILLAILLFEGVTNLRVPSIWTPRVDLEEEERITSKPTAAPEKKAQKFEAERAMRLVVVAVVAPTYLLFYDAAWAVTWLLGFALVAAGLIGYCPIVKILHSLGFS